METNQRIKCHCKYTTSQPNVHRGGMGWDDITTRKSIVFSVAGTPSENDLFEWLKYDIMSACTLEKSDYAWLRMKLTMELENGPVTRRYSSYDLNDCEKTRV